MPITTLLLLSLSVNVPLGYLRSRCRKLSWPWFAYVHLSIPLIAGLRIYNRLGWGLVPLFIACAVAGQLAGGAFRRRRLPPR